MPAFSLLMVLCAPFTDLIASYTIKVKIHHLHNQITALRCPDKSTFPFFDIFPHPHLI